MVKTLFQTSTWNALEAGSFDGAVSVRELLRCAEHTISLRQTECRKTGETITAAVYEYLVEAILVCYVSAAESFQKQSEILRPKQIKSYL